jgi:hypothetical protein
MSDKARGAALGIAGTVLVAAMGGAVAVSRSVATEQATMVGAVASGEVTVCAKKTTGAMRLPKAGKKCKRTEVTLTWNTTGPQGPAGATGATGPAGSAADVAALQTQVTQLATQVASLQATLAGVTRVDFQGQPTVRFSGVNVQVVDGQDETTGGTVNGRGNLIVGWNENSNDARTGSHNLVIGPYHSYASYGGLVAGYDNFLSSDPYASVTGGMANHASGIASSVAGGVGNSATGDYDTVLGGDQVSCSYVSNAGVCGEGALNPND